MQFWRHTHVPSNLPTPLTPPLWLKPAPLGTLMSLVLRHTQKLPTTRRKTTTTRRRRTTMSIVT